MNRTQGFATAFAFFLAALFRPGVGHQPVTPKSPPAAGHASGDTGSPKIDKEDGPWSASYRYWEPARTLAQQEGQYPANVQSTSSDACGTVVSKRAASGGEPATKREQAGDRWGIPCGSDVVKPDITAIIATVPDPVHTHLALEYDRDVDALLQAAADNGFLSSFFWVPWKLPAEVARPGEPLTAEELAEQKKREKQPGLLILKHARRPEEPLQTNYDRVIYLFLVSESPASGMNGEQLRNALWYEEELRCLRKPKKIVVNLSMRSADDLQITGAAVSGAAASLREAAEQARRSPGLGVRTVHVAGVTSTEAADLELNAKDKSRGAWLSYVSFGDDDEFEESSIVKMLQGAGYIKGRPFAELIEDGTVFGQSRVFLPQAGQSGKGKSSTSSTQPDSGADKPILIRFPREISLLRNAETSDSGSSAPSPYLHLTLKDSAADDTMRPFSTDQTPLSQEAALMAIQRELLTHHVQFLAIQASDVLDKIFLAGFLHRACPDVRFIFLGGSDRLLEREGENQASVGSLTLTPYDLVGLAENRLDARAFPDESSQQTYNAASYTFSDVPIEAGEVVKLKGLNSIAQVESVGKNGQVQVVLADQRRTIQQSDVLESPLGTRYDEAKMSLHPGDLVAFTTQAHIENVRKNGTFDVSIGSAKGTIRQSDFAREPPILAGYQPSRDTPNLKNISHSSLWATVLGNDGYYAMGIVSHCGSGRANILPSLGNGYREKCDSSSPEPSASDELQQFEGMPPVYPSLLWTIVSVLLGLYCIAHLLLLWSANYWSPFTRDLAIQENDQPQRRSVYINIGTVMLFSAAWVLETPVFTTGPAFQVNPVTKWVARIVLFVASWAVLYTWWKTRRYAWKTDKWTGWKNYLDTLQRDRACYRFFNRVAFLAWILIPVTWSYICQIDQAGAAPRTIHSKYGMFFSYRCLHPLSGVSPAVPVFLVLAGWYLWAVCQTYRLRFSNANRPRLPGRFAAGDMFFVSDDTLSDCGRLEHSCLFHNITCLLITRELLQRFLPKLKRSLTIFLAAAFLVLSILVLWLKPIRSLDRLLLHPGALPTVYEALLTTLLVPLAVVALAGWLRAILVWGALRRSMLEPLERSPLRGAFTRLKGLGWMAMMRETGLHLRWKDMSRTRESIQQLMNNEEMKEVTSSPSVRSILDCRYEILQEHLKDVRKLSHGDVLEEQRKEALRNNLANSQVDRLENENRTSLAGIYALEQDYAAFCKLLLQFVLVPYWTNHRGGFVEGESTDLAPIHAKRNQKAEAQAHDPLQLHTGSASADPLYIQLAEELLALRYVSLIRAVLGNLRYLMTFVAAVYVLTIVAWNSYPFQPRQAMDWIFTIIFLLFGGGMFWMLAQMHRNAILSRITDTSPNELGWDFYLRLATFGAIPLLTWLAYQFPEAGSWLFRLVQPGLSAPK